jgi:hypothetical protein
MFATFILVLFYRYDRVTTLLWIRYPRILLGEGYNWHLYACRLFCGYEMPTLSHELRGDKESFNKGKSVRKGPPKQKLREDIMKTLGEPKESQDYGFEGYGKKHNWTHKSCIWELPYAKALILPHNIDLMHQERNVAEGIISMYFDVTDFPKDSFNARKGLADLCNRPSMEPKINAKGNLKRTLAPYCLKLLERKEILRWLKKLNFPDRYPSNIKQAVNVSTGKLNELKSHDYHIIIERLMLVMFCGYFDADLWKIFAELIYFNRQICAKQVSKSMMQKLEKEITVLVCKMEKIFPPGLFNEM